MRFAFPGPGFGRYCSVLLVGIVFTASAVPQPGSIDPAFHRHSILDGAAFASAVTGDGRLILGGAFTRVTGVPRRGVARFTETGTLDEMFNRGIGIEGGAAAVYGLAIYTAGAHSGKIIVAGSFTQFDRVDRRGIARLNPDGSLDAGFNPGSGIDDGDVYAVAIQPDGKVLVGGDFTSVRGKARNGVARFNVDGTLDGGFTVGEGADDTVYAVAVQPDGKILVAGAFTTFRGTERPGIARLTSSGNLDTASRFDPGTGAEDGAVYALALQEDGKILIGGDFTYFQGESRDGLARLNSNGSIDPEFAPDSGGLGAVVWAVVSPGRGKVVVAGEFSTMANVECSGFAVLDYNGRVDSTFTNTGPDALLFSVDHGEYVLTLAPLPDGSVIAGGTFELVDNQYRPGLVRILADGAVDRVYNQESGTFDAVLASAIQPDGKIVLAGRFTLANGEPRRGLARLNPDGTLDTGFDIGRGVVGRVHALQLHTNGPQPGPMIIGGTCTEVNGTAVTGLARIEPDGTVDTSFRPVITPGEVYALVLQSDGRVVIGGAFTNVNGFSRNGLARLEVDGRIDPSFDPGSGVAGGAVYGMALQRDGAIVFAGAFQTVNGVSRAGVARIDSSGRVDTSFDPGSGLTGGVARAVVVQEDGAVVVAGGFSTADGTPSRGIVRLDRNGRLDPTFHAREGVAAGEVLSLAMQGDGKILLGGSFTTYGNVHCGGIARLKPDGSFDYEFDAGAGVARANASVHSVTVQPNGKVIVGGSFIDFDGVEVWGLTRLVGGEGTPEPPAIEWWPPALSVLSGDTAVLAVEVRGSKPLGFEWLFGNEVLTGRTNALLEIPGIATNQAGSYVVVVTNAYGAATSSPVVVTVIPTIDLSEALSAPALTWTTTGHHPWYGQTATGLHGGGAGQSGPLQDGQLSQVSTAVEGPGWLTFWWKVSSEEEFDWLEFQFNGVESDRISGDVDWTSRTVEIPRGPATLTWVYRKDDVYSDGQDAGWLGGVNYIQVPALVPATSPDGFQLDIWAAPGQRVEIQTSDTLADWTTIRVLADVVYPFRFIDGETTNTHRFYRLLTP